MLVGPILIVLRPWVHSHVQPKRRSRSAYMIQRSANTYFAHNVSDNPAVAQSCFRTIGTNVPCLIGLSMPAHKTPQLSTKYVMWHPLRSTHTPATRNKKLSLHLRTLMEHTHVVGTLVRMWQSFQESRKRREKGHNMFTTCHHKHWNREQTQNEKNKSLFDTNLPIYPQARRGQPHGFSVSEPRTLKHFRRNKGCD